jgi:hypothetical protein
MEEAVDDIGRRWLIPGTVSNYIYRADNDGKNISRFELDSYGLHIATGAGFVWVIPSNIDPDAKVVWITASNTRSDKVYRVDPETGKVSAKISLPVPFGIGNITVGQDYVWIYGRKKVGFFNWSYPFLATRIDAKSLQVLGTYELPNPVPLKDGREISPLIEPQLLLINEGGYLLLAYWPKGASQPGHRITVKYELDTGEYSELAWPLKPEEMCPQGEKIFLTKRGKRDIAVQSSEVSCP